jgi:hypothetical protein
LATVADAAASAERRAILERPEMVASLPTVLSDDSKKTRCFGLDGFGQSRVVVASLEHAPHARLLYLGSAKIWLPISHIS